MGDYAMRRQLKRNERRKQGDRRVETAGPWREDLERRSGGSRRGVGTDRRQGMQERRFETLAQKKSAKKNRLLGKSPKKWMDSSLVLETAALAPTRSMRRVKLCNLIELGRCDQERDLGIYVSGVLTGAVIRDEDWQVWRIIEACNVECAGELRMYADRLSLMAKFPTLKEARNFVKGPFKRYILAEMKAARVLKTG